MAKIRTTRKALKEEFRLQVAVPYCHLQAAIKHLRPFAYTSGIYGWNFDAYDINGILLTTGYRNLLGRQVPYELAKKVEHNAIKIYSELETSNFSNEKWEKAYNALNKNLIKMCNKVCK